MPMPRIEKFAVPREVPISSKPTLGMPMVRSPRERTLAAANCSASKAVIDTGTSWIDCSRFWAVTTTSASSVALSGAEAASGAG